ncbi:MAG TPA: hypothetical protein VGF79_11795 [Bacteroidia bacterium]
MKNLKHILVQRHKVACMLFLIAVLGQNLSAQRSLTNMNQASPTAFMAEKGRFAMYGSVSMSWGMSYGLGEKTSLHAGNYLPVSANYYPIWTGLSLKQQLLKRYKFQLSAIGGALTSFNQDENYKYAWNTGLISAFGTELHYLSIQVGMVNYKKNPKILSSNFPYLSIGGRTQLNYKWSFTGNLFFGFHDNDFGESGGDDQSYIFEGGAACNFGFRRDWSRASMYLGLIVAAIDENSDIPPIYPNIGFSFGL